MEEELHQLDKLQSK
jgi:hypothetical protein